MNTKLPEILACPTSWKYDEKWWQRYLKGIKPDALLIACKHSSTEFKIGHFICDLGEVALTKLKTQNLYVKRLKAGTATPSSIGPHDIDWQSGHTWLNLLQSWEELFEIYNASQAPADIKEIISEVKTFMDTGQSHCQALLQYIEESRLAKVQAQEQNYERQNTQNSRGPSDAKWKDIDIAHSKVVEGFIYLLSNQLMPGIYKIGFTAGNPDKRAKEISAKHGLPQPFEVVHYWRTLDPYIVEQRIHDALSAHNRSGEFFELQLDFAKDTIQKHLVHVQSD